MLADLARHPATARHVAVKLARHFIADDPPPQLVEKLTQRFLDTDGDLKEVTKTLVSAPESWSREQAKIKRPGEWIVAGRRATGTQGQVARMERVGALLGEPLWQPPAPKGFPDDNAAWLDGLVLRLQSANTFAQRVGDGLDPQAVLETALGRRPPRRRAAPSRGPSKAAGARVRGDGAGISAQMMEKIMSARAQHPACHAATRRELLGSGVPLRLGTVPRSRGEGRDRARRPSCCALDGLAAVAPVGDPGSSCAATTRWLDGRRRRCRSMGYLRSIRQCRTCIASIRPARPPSCMRSRRPIGTAPT